jgi:WD40 repeat protein
VRVAHKVKFVRIELILFFLLTLALTACSGDTPVPTKEPLSLQQPYNDRITAPTVVPPTAAVVNSAGKTPVVEITVPNRPSPNSGALTPDLKIPELTRPPALIEGRPISTVISNPNEPLIAELSYLQAGDLWVISEKGTNKRQLTRTANLTPEKVRWSPTGEKVAFIDAGNAVHVIELQDGKDTVYFRPSRNNQLAHYLEWSPNGRYIAFEITATSSLETTRPEYDARIELATKGEIWFVDAQSPTPNALKIADGFNFAWSPDSKYLAYPSRARRVAQIDTSVAPVAVGTIAAPTPRSNPVFEIGATPSPSAQATAGRGTPAATTTRAANTTASATTKASPPPVVISADRTPTAGSPVVGIQSSVTPKPSVQPTVKTTVSPTVAGYNPNRVFKAPFDNNLVVWEVSSRLNRTLAESGRLPGYPAFDGSIYPVESTAVQTVAWSPDAKTVMFGDQISFVGSAGVVDNSVRMWLGQPRNFALNKVFWLPDSSGTLMLWNNYAGEPRSYFGVLTTPGVLATAASDTINCPAMSPAGNLLAYASATDTLVVRPDGTTVGGLVGGGCPAWSPDGTQLIAPRRVTDGSLVMFTLDGKPARQLIGTRAVDFVFWIS